MKRTLFVSLLVLAALSFQSEANAAKASFFFSCPEGKGELTVQDDATRPFVSCVLNGQYSTPISYAGATGAPGIKSVVVECPGAEVPTQSLRRFSCASGDKPVVSVQDSGAGERETGAAADDECVKTSVIHFAGSDCLGGSSNPIFALVQFVINFMIKLLIPIAVLIIVVSGIQYTVSQGDPAAVKGAKTRILNAVMGLILLSLLFAIINFIRT